MPSVLIAGAALVFSYWSLLVNYRASRAPERRGRMAVLVFRGERTSTGLTLDNVGNGPAMNIIFAQGQAGTPGAPSPIRLEKGVHEPWFNPIHLRPVEPHGTQDLPWDTRDGLGVTQTDALGVAYRMKASDDGMRILEGLHLPTWDIQEIPYLFELDDRKPDGPRWLQQGPDRRVARTKR